jgi:hypothetical protein
MGWAALVGGGVAIAGNAATAVGTRDANKRQDEVNREEMDFQRGVDDENAKKLEQLLASYDADSRIGKEQQARGEERTALDDVVNTQVAARGKVTAAGSEAAQGEITRSLEGVGARGRKMAGLAARIRSQKIEQQDMAKRDAQYGVDRNRLVGKSRGRQRLYPLLMHAASMKGTELRQGGRATSQLGMLLMQYGLSGGGEAAGAESAGGTSAQNLAITEAPRGGWMASSPNLA